MLKFISIEINPMGVQIACLLASTHSKKLYAYLVEIWDMLLLRHMCQSEISYHDVTFTLERRGTNYRKSYGCVCICFILKSLPRLDPHILRLLPGLRSFHVRFLPSRLTRFRAVPHLHDHYVLWIM